MIYLDVSCGIFRDLTLSEDKVKPSGIQGSIDGVMGRSEPDGHIISSHHTIGPVWPLPDYEKIFNHFNHRRLLWSCNNQHSIKV